MAYATRTDLEQRYGADEITQREDVLPAGAIDRALADAEALIDSYCGGRYAVPLTPAPSVIPQVACAIARYKILGDAESDRARADFEDALRWLKDVQAGRVQIQDAAPLAGSSPASTVTMVSAGSVFKRAGRP